MMLNKWILSSNVVRQSFYDLLPNTRMLFFGLIGALLLAIGFIELTQLIKNHDTCQSSQFAQKTHCGCGNNCSCENGCGCN